jgi:hypothetical protein
MTYSADELLPRAREAARQILAVCEDGRWVQRWVQDYAAKHGRRVLPVGPDDERERLEALNREALLAICSRLNEELRKHIAGRRKKLTGFDALAADAFRAEFYLFLAKSMRWGEAELEEFWRDLDQYAEFAAHSRASRSSGAANSAFADRFAILLDSSMFDRARKAAAAMLPELERITATALRAAFRKRV